ncbi:MAG TPA: GNAT family N-acetyltransferase [Lacunisphaera sp.]|nr:GNAT family N-acetyltransferase [Lacunisphaera sp.]
METRHGEYLISDDPARLDAAAIHGYLRRSYWCENIPLETVRRSLANSLCIGAYAGASQVGLVRVISDYATYAYLCDVYVLEEHRSRGVARAMMTVTVRHPRLQGLRSWNLRTRDAHPLYAEFGFQVVDDPGRYMIRRLPGGYHTAPGSGTT